MKTLKEWNKKGGSFTDYAKPGDKIDEGIYDYFIGVMFPVRMDYRGFLMGECVRHNEDGDGTYECFTQLDGYKYVGEVTIEHFDSGRRLWQQEDSISKAIG